MEPVKNTVSIPLFLREKTGEKQPDYSFSEKTETGFLNVLSAWIRTSKSGVEYISLNIDIDALLEYARLQKDHKSEGVRTKVAQDEGFDSTEDLPF